MLAMIEAQAAANADLIIGHLPIRVVGLGRSSDGFANLSDATSPDNSLRVCRLCPRFHLPSFTKPMHAAP
jgi:hypothetical protein